VVTLFLKNRGIFVTLIWGIMMTLIAVYWGILMDLDTATAYAYIAEYYSDNNGLK
jgi:hypothetical protein